MIRCSHSSRLGFSTVMLALVLGPATVASCADVPEAVLAAQNQRIAAIAKAKAAAVSVFSRGGRGGGSGVVISPDGFALTNFHVSKPAGNHMSCSMADGRLYDAVIVGIDPTGDVALIKLLGRDDFPCAELADSDKVRVGDWCFAVGNPFLLATDFQPTVTYGIVSGVHRYQYPSGTLLEYADCIQTDASINPGNSGGPLFNAEGNLIGINGRGSFEKRGRVNVGVGYAISINQIKNFMGYLHSGRIVDHATAGFTVTQDEDGRVVVSNIIESSDAHRRGLRYGDEIVSFGGRAITTTNELKNVLGIYPKGWRIPLTYVNEDQRHEILVRLAGVHGSAELISKIQRAPQPPAKPKDDDHQPKEKDKPDKPKPVKPTGAPKAAPIPQHVAKLIKARNGYANYYFNELNRNRVWESFIKSADYSKLTGLWRMSGKNADGNDIEIILGPEEVSARFPTGPVTINTNEDDSNELGDQIAPAGSGGLLLALHLWRRLLTLSPGQYGKVYYLGTAPTPTSAALADVLVGTHKVVETQFMFDPSSGHLIGIEMYPDLDVDPCEIYFSNYRDVDGRTLPHRMEVRFGDKVFTTIDIEQFEFTAKEKKEA